MRVDWTETDGPCPVCQCPRCQVTHLRLVAGPVVETGLWCDSCALPSVVIHVIAGTCEHGWPVTVTDGRIAVCMDCRRHGPVLA